MGNKFIQCSASFRQYAMTHTATSSCRFCEKKDNPCACILQTGWSEGCGPGLELEPGKRTKKIACPG
eukprot:1155910-Pelagomonas_calceolata.AAC.5